MQISLPRAFFGIAALLLFAAQASADPRPNVVFILADDLRPDGLHSLGNAVVKSPHLDSIVDRGFVFREAHIMGAMVSAVCLPSRTMLLTGQSLFRAGNQASLADPNAWTFPGAMRAAGYATIHAGKWGNSPKKITDEFDESHDDKTAAANADQVIDFVHRHAGQKPLFIYYAPNEPHDPQVAEKSYYDMYRPEDIPPAIDPLPYHPFDNGEVVVRDEMTLPWPRTRENVAGKLARYYASISYLDAQVGRILDALKSAGQFDQTIFIVAGDNGLSLGEHGLLGKQNLYEFGGMHVPLAMAGPGISKGDTKALVYLMDVFPTVCEFTGIPVPTRVEGKSLRPIIRGEAPRVREYAFTAFKDVQRAIRDERWKLIRYPQIDKTQLFDLQSDPHEMRDLASDPASAARIRELTGELEKEQRELGDTVPLTVANPKPAPWSPAQLTPAQLAAQAEETAICAGLKVAEKKH
jgi:arylsulfatase A-like enzyme